jgi:hypothetical protein
MTRTKTLAVALAIATASVAPALADVDAKTSCSDINAKVDRLSEPDATMAAIGKVVKELDEGRDDFGLPRLIPLKLATLEAQQDFMGRTTLVCRVHPSWTLEDAARLTYGIMARRYNEETVADKSDEITCATVHQVFDEVPEDKVDEGKVQYIAMMVEKWLREVDREYQERAMSSIIYPMSKDGLRYVVAGITSSCAQHLDKLLKQHTLEIYESLRAMNVTIGNIKE